MTFIIIEKAIGKAAVFADVAHSGQHRKSSGEPYIKHPIGAYKILRKVGVKDTDVLTAAILHDTLEDTDATYNTIKKEFNKNVADLVKEVTSDKLQAKALGKPNYLLNKMLKMSDNALLIKLADRLHNLQDIATVSPEFAKKMREQTRFIIIGIKEKRNLNSTQKKLIRMISKIINEK